jgi:hypothetical protein
MTSGGGAGSISSSSRSGTARRKIASTTESLAGGTRWMLYCNWPNATPSVMQWNGRGWGPAPPRSTSAR